MRNNQIPNQSKDTDQDPGILRDQHQKNLQILTLIKYQITIKRGN